MSKGNGKQPALEVQLRRAVGSAGSTQWALSGAGSKKRPPTPERAKALTEKLAKETALVHELRARRDELKTEVAA